MEHSSKFKEKIENEKPFIDNLITRPNIIIGENEENKKIDQIADKKKKKKKIKMVLKN